AAVMAAQGYIDKGQKKYATRVLKKAWEAQPHPDLAAAFAQIEPEETTAARLKRFGQLTKSHPNHPETRMLMAELNLAAEDFPAARRALGDLIETDLTTRSATLMAAIERGEGASDAVVQGWLARAVTAPRGPQWVCENCHNIHAAWAPTCDNCGAFDTMAWTQPPNVELSLPGGSEMLPLLVGTDKTGSSTVVPLDPNEPASQDDDVVDAEDLGNPATKAS
ncbi:MAG: heme biosynthesis protein HemY, partial [Pseudomonadota bacterium]